MRAVPLYCTANSASGSGARQGNARQAHASSMSATCNVRFSSAINSGEISSMVTGNISAGQPGPSRQGSQRNVLVGALGGVAVLALIVALVVFHGKGRAPTSTPQSPPAASQQSSASPEGQPAAQGSGGPANASASSGSQGEQNAAAPASHAGSGRQAVASLHHRHHRHAGPGSAFPRGGRPAVAGANGQENVPSERVSFVGLDLSTHAGACAALRRIRRAAEDVCPTDDRPLYLWREARQCQQEAIARAIHDTHSARLKALSESRSAGC